MHLCLVLNFDLALLLSPTKQNPFHFERGRTAKNDQRYSWVHIYFGILGQNIY